MIAAIGAFAGSASGQSWRAGRRRRPAGAVAGFRQCASSHRPVDSPAWHIRHNARALVRDQHRDARPHPLLRHALFMFRDGGLRHDHGAAPARLDPRRPQTDRSGGRVHHSRLRRHRHAGLVLLRVARAEPSCLRGQRTIPGPRARRRSPAVSQVFRRFSDAGERDHRAVRSPSRQAQGQGARQDPASAFEPAMVHRRGTRHAGRQRRKAWRSHPYAPRRNAVSEAIRATPRRRRNARWTSSSGSAC